jgi:outer membrane biogenesis lipoprotein LolB
VPFPVSMSLKESLKESLKALVATLFPRSCSTLGALAFVACVFVLLGGCANTHGPSSPEQAASEAVILGQWGGRFAVKVDRVTLAETQSSQQDSAQGSFSLESMATGTILELTSPLGQTLAIIASMPTLATLTLADGKRFEAANAQDLLEKQLGWRLPIDRLPKALVVLSASAIPAESKAKAIADALGRDWAAQLSELDGGRARLVLTWDGLSRNVSKLALTLIIEHQVGVSTNLRR